MVGGTVGDSYYTVFDVDSLGNMAIGGYSSDTSLVSSTGTPNAFLQYIIAPSATQWAL